jgi:hypothetical protein
MRRGVCGATMHKKPVVKVSAVSSAGLQAWRHAVAADFLWINY